MGFSPGVLIQASAGCPILKLAAQQRALRRFSNSCGVSGIVPCGFFLRKKPLESIGFALYQLENRFRVRQHNPYPRTKS
jgi:hypothetical protein